MIKKTIRRIDVEVDNRRPKNVATGRVVITRWRGRIDEYNSWGVYKLTERNYWRAVGMQLRLAGFAKQVDNPSRSQ